MKINKLEAKLKEIPIGEGDIVEIVLKSSKKRLYYFGRAFLKGDRDKRSILVYKAMVKPKNEKNYCLDNPIHFNIKKIFEINTLTRYYL